MPVLNKEKHLFLKRELESRYTALVESFSSRELKNACEGVKGSWLHPDKLCATVGDKFQLRLIIEDFKTILSEIKRIT